MRGVSWNLSQGGMQVEVSDVKPEEAVQLSFRLPVSGVAVDVVGVVAWAERSARNTVHLHRCAESAVDYPIHSRTHGALMGIY